MSLSLASVRRLVNRYWIQLVGHAAGTKLAPSPVTLMWMFLARALPYVLVF